MQFFYTGNLTWWCFLCEQKGKSMKKKILMFILMVCLIIPVVFIFSACDNKSDEQSEEDQTVMYEINISEDIEHGTIIPSKTKATAGETITLTVNPDSCYELMNGSLKYNDQVVVDYSFVMPSEDVVISASFVYIVNVDSYPILREMVSITHMKK